MSNRIGKEFQEKLWAAANALRGNISAEQYMHIVIGILFLKNMSSIYSKACKEIEASYEGDRSTWLQDWTKDRDILARFGASFIVPKNASWEYLSNYAASPEIGEKIDRAFELIEQANPTLQGLFNKNYNRIELDQSKLGRVISELSVLDIEKHGKNIVGDTYEFFLGKFFKDRGQKSGEFYTPPTIVDLMVNIVDPKKGKLYDPTAGTGGMFIHALERIEKTKGNTNELVIYGQEFQHATWTISKINLLLHGVNSNNIHLGAISADTFTNDQYKGQKFDYILANPPFNYKDWGSEKLQDDARFKWGIPPKNNANYAFLSHMIDKLASKGRGATVLSNGSLSSSRKAELQIRKGLIEDNLIDAIITLPPKLFFTTQIPACIWIFNKNKKNHNILMVDGSNFKGNVLSKKLIELSDKEIDLVTSAYHQHNKGGDVNIEGLAKTITKEELDENYMLLPGRYIDIVEEVVDKEELRKNIEEMSRELRQLNKDYIELMPKVEKSIKKIIEETNKKEK